MNKSRKIAITGMRMSMAALSAQAGPSFRQDFDGNSLTVPEDKPKRINSNKPSKKRAKTKLARKQKHRK